MFAKMKWKDIQNRIKHIKLSTRITLSTIFLFSILIILIMYFVSVLTDQFLYFKNREDLMMKQEQIQDFFQDENREINKVMRTDRLSYMYRALETYYVFDNYKTLIILFDTDGRSSYALNQDAYDNLFREKLKIDPKNLHFNIMVDKKSEPNQHRLNLEVFKSINASESVKLFNSSLRIPSNSKEPIITETSIFEYDIMYTSLRYDTHDDYSVYVCVFLYPNLDQDFIIGLNSALLVSALIGILILTIIGKAFTRRALKPLVDLSNIAHKVNNETLNYRIPATGSNDEIDLLIKSLNTMLENLDQSFEYQKRFVSDASHELRIPLTIVLGYIELLKKVGTDDPAILEESLNAIGDEATLMKNLVEKLLMLTRIENNRIRVNSENLVLDEFIQKNLSECQMLYPTHVFTVQARYQGTLHFDPELMTQMFRALVENAVKYSEPGSEIVFGSQLRNQFIEISITDQGRGIPKESLGYLVHRFYRISEDRNRRTGGSGLGLSIVEALVKAMGGYLRIESELDKGTKVILLMPRKTPE